MNKIFEKLSRRERLAVLIAAVALFAGLILYPALRASMRYRQDTLDTLEETRALCAGYQTLLLSADPIRTENSELKKVLSQTDGLLFDRVGNDVMMEASIIKLLNQLAPDLGLEISMAKTSLRGAPGQLSFSLKGSGRYPEVLNFLYKIETHRPLIVVDHFEIEAQSSRGSSSRGRSGPPQTAQRSTASTTASEPRIRLKMEIHINCRTAEESQ
jgi:hypothetical protein